MNKFCLTILLFLLTIVLEAKTLGDVHSFKVDEDSNDLYVFVGSKISIVRAEREEYKIEIDSITGDTNKRVLLYFDSKYLATYKVITNIYNNLKLDTITFEVYNHYGRPYFEPYDTVLLYVSSYKAENKFYLQKYLFDPLKLENGMLKGLEGQSIQILFEEKKKGVLKNRGIFK